MKEFDTHRYQVLFICAAGLLVVVIATCFLIPIVFKVLRTNKMVMALFGQIKIEHIKELADKCDLYLENILSEKKDDDRTKSRKSNSKKHTESLTESKVQGNENGEEFDTKTEKPRGNIADLISEESGQKKMEAQLMNSGRKGYDSGSGSTQNKKRKKKGKKDKESKVVDGKKRKKGRGKGKQQAYEEDEDEFDEEEENAGDKFSNSKDSSKKKIVFLFMLMAFATMVPFIVIGLWEVLTYSEMIFLYGHLQYIIRLIK